jgi:beta-glucanase (GH16 family)
MGVHPFGDPRLVDDFEAVAVATDVRDFHVYAVDWTPEGASFSVDGVTRKTVAQAPDYPVQLMLGIYEFPESVERPPDAYPKVFEVDYVRGYGLDG